MKLFKMIIGVGLIIGGGILEVMWLSFLFGSVLGVVLVLIFAPHYLVMPWTIGMVTGLSLMGSSNDGTSLSSNIEGAQKSLSKFSNSLLKFVKFSAVVFLVVLLGAGIYLLYDEKVTQEKLENTMAPYAASLLDDIKNGGFDDIIEKRQIRNWNSENYNKIKFDDTSRLGCGVYNQDEFGIRTKDCRFSSKITNNSDKYIEYVVVKIAIMNEESGKVVAEENETFKVSIVPSATKEIEVYFDNSNFKRAAEQLEGNWTWTFQFMGAIPQDMTFYSFDHNWF